MDDKERKRLKKIYDGPSYKSYILILLLMAALGSGLYLYSNYQQKCESKGDYTVCCGPRFKLGDCSASKGPYVLFSSDLAKVYDGTSQICYMTNIKSEMPNANFQETNGSFVTCMKDVDKAIRYNSKLPVVVFGKTPKEPFFKAYLLTKSLNASDILSGRQVFEWRG